MKERLITGLYFFAASLLALVPLYLLYGAVRGEGFALVGSLFVSLIFGVWFSPFAFVWGALLSDLLARHADKTPFISGSWFCFVGSLITALALFSGGAVVGLGHATNPIVEGARMVLTAAVWSMGSVFLVGGLTGVVRGRRIYKAWNT